MSVFPFASQFCDMYDHFPVSFVRGYCAAVDSCCTREYGYSILESNLLIPQEDEASALNPCVPCSLSIVPHASARDQLYWRIGGLLVKE